MTQSSHNKTDRRVIDAMLEQGVTFEMPGVIFGRRQITIRQPYLGTLDCITREFLKIDFCEQRVQENPQAEARRLITEGALPMARAIATAVLNSRIKIKLFRGALARYLLWKVTPQRLFHILVLVSMISNTADFINAIRLTAATQTTATRADLIAKKAKPGQKDSAVHGEPGEASSPISAGLTNTSSGA